MGKVKEGKKEVQFKCKHCNKMVPQLQYFPHLIQEHPAVMAEIRQKALQKRWGKVAPTGATTEPPPGTTETPTGATTEPPPGTTTEPPASSTAAKPQSPTATIKGRFITKEIDLPGEILVFYWLAKAAFPAYDATEGQWIFDCIEQFYAEHAQELGLDKLLDKSYQIIPVEVKT